MYCDNPMEYVPLGELPTGTIETVRLKPLKVGLGKRALGSGVDYSIGGEEEGPRKRL